MGKTRDNSRSRSRSRFSRAASTSATRTRRRRSSKTQNKSMTPRINLSRVKLFKKHNIDYHELKKYEAAASIGISPKTVSFNMSKKTITLEECLPIPDLSQHLHDVFDLIYQGIKYTMKDGSVNLIHCDPGPQKKPNVMLLNNKPVLIDWGEDCGLYVSMEVQDNMNDIYLDDYKEMEHGAFKFAIDFFVDVWYPRFHKSKISLEWFDDLKSYVKNKHKVDIKTTPFEERFVRTRQKRQSALSEARKLQEERVNALLAKRSAKKK